jgi:hypothetical protein
MNNYDNLDFCLSTLYDYRYNDKHKKCLEFQQIIIKNIKIADLKKSDNFDKTNILKKHFKFLGKWNDEYHYKLYCNNFQCNMTIGIYDRQINKDNFENKNMKNIKMLYILSEFSFEIPILLPLMNFDISYEELENLNKNVVSFMKKEKGENLYINITEHYFKMKNLEQFIMKKYKKINLLKWKTLIFYVLYSLHILQNKFKSFQHNDLNLTSIMIYEKNKKNTMYKINDSIFVIPDTEFEIRITNFGNYTTNETDLKPYLDQQTFFNDLKNLINKLNIHIEIEFKNFINYVIENNDLYPSLILQKNNFFSEFIKMNSDTSFTDSSVDLKGGNIDDDIDFTDSSGDDNDNDKMVGGKRKHHHHHHGGDTSDSIKNSRISEKLSEVISKVKNGINSMGIPRNNATTPLGNPNIGNPGISNPGLGNSIGNALGANPYPNIPANGMQAVNMPPPNMPMPQNMPIMPQPEMPQNMPMMPEMPINNMPINNMPMMPEMPVNNMPMMPEMPMMPNAPPNGIGGMPQMGYPMMGGGKKYKLVKNKKNFF